MRSHHPCNDQRFLYQTQRHLLDTGTSGPPQEDLRKQTIKRREGRLRAEGKRGTISKVEVGEG